MEKQEQIKPKSSKQKENILKIDFKKEIFFKKLSIKTTETETKETIKKINEFKKYFFIRHQFEK